MFVEREIDEVVFPVLELQAGLVTVRLDAPFEVVNQDRIGVEVVKRGSGPALHNRF